MNLHESVIEKIHWQEDNAQPDINFLIFKLTIYFLMNWKNMLAAHLFLAESIP